MLLIGWGLLVEGLFSSLPQVTSMEPWYYHSPWEPGPADENSSCSSSRSRGGLICSFPATRHQLNLNQSAYPEAEILPPGNVPLGVDRTPTAQPLNQPAYPEAETLPPRSVPVGVDRTPTAPPLNQPAYPAEAERIPQGVPGLSLGSMTVRIKEVSLPRSLAVLGEAPIPFHGCPSRLKVLQLHRL